MLRRNMIMIRTPHRFRPDALFRPTSVAVIGAASEAGRQVMANMMAGGFRGAVLPVDASVAAISGVLTYAAVADLPIAPDLAVICAGEPNVLFPALAARGTFAAVLIGMADHVRESADATGVRVFGPGSFGICVPEIGLHATRSHLLPTAGRVALVSQSPALCRAVLDWAAPNGVGFSHVVGVGGNTDLGFAPVLDWLSRDAGTGAILLDIRRIRDRRLFLSAARAAARLRPVVAMHAGGLLADPSGMADAAFEAALRRAGVLCVDRLEDLLAAAETLTRARPARGEGLAIVTNAVGPAQMAADAVLRDGLSLAVLTPETRSVMQMLVHSAFGGAEAPSVLGDIIYADLGHPIRLAEAASLLSGASEVGGVLIVHAPTGEADQSGIAAIAAGAKAMKVPLLVCVMGETTGALHRRYLAAADVPVFASPEQAVRGFRHLVEDRRNRAAARELPPSAMLHIAPDRALVRRLFAELRATGACTLTPDMALAVLRAYGMAVREPGPGFAVHHHELFIAVAEDAIFGPIIRFGQGGAGFDILGDIAVDLPPLNLSLAHALIARTRVARALRKAEAAWNEAGIADALVRVSQLVVDFPEIAALDINPLFVNADRAVVGTAGLSLRPLGAAPGRLAISPYPAELAMPFDAKGETLLIRPIRPEDAAAHGAFFSRLSPEDVRFRFFAAMRELSAEQMARMTQVDYEREMAFVAVREGAAGSETVGVARLVREGAENGEFAVVVQPDMKGRGVARVLLQNLMLWGRAQGLAEIAGQILADNRPMLAFIRSLGFTIHALPGEDDVVEARLHL